MALMPVQKGAEIRWRFSGCGGRRFKLTVSLASIGPEIVERLAQAVNDPALEPLANRHAQGRAQGNDFAARMDALDFAQRHEQDVVIPKTDNLGQRGTIVARGFDAAVFTDAGERAFRLDDQADELDHATVVADDLRLLDAAQEALHPADWRLLGRRHHVSRLRFIRSNLVSRRASTVPKRV